MNIQPDLSVPSSDSSLMVDRMKKQNADTVRRIRLLEMDWPGAVDVIKGVFSHITDGIVVDKTPLVYMSARDALIAYGEALEENLPDPARLENFINTFFEALAYYLGPIKVQSGNQIWTCRSAVGLAEWIERTAEKEREQKVTYDQDAAMDVALAAQLKDRFVSQGMRTVLAKSA